MTLVMSGVGVALPGADGAPGWPEAPTGRVPVEPGARIGGRGLRYKDRATQLALCAARDALVDARLLEETLASAPAETVAVVASSNFGNLDTVCRVVDTLSEETVLGTSPMDLPNASSNVMASSIAIRFGLRGPNLMLCNGATSGLDAVGWAITLLTAKRASQVLVVGAEPDNEFTRRLLGGQPTIDGAAAVVVESVESAAARGVAARAVVQGYAHDGELGACLRRLADSASSPVLWYGPEGDAWDTVADSPAGAERRDLDAWGTASGALGLVQCAAAVDWFDRDGKGPVFAVNGWGPGRAVAGLALLAPEALR